MSQAAQTSQPAAFPSGGVEEIPSSGLLSFYDRLRERAVETARRRGGRLGEKATRALLTVPDVFMLLLRLSLDPEVPASTRALLGGALAYFVLPIDILPEGVLGPAGYLEDLVVAVAVLARALGPELEPRARAYWSGSEELRVVLADVARTADAFLGDSVYRRLQRLLARWGVEL